MAEEVAKAPSGHTIPDAKPALLLGGYLDTPPVAGFRGKPENRIQAGYYRLYSNGLLTYAKKSDDAAEMRVKWIDHMGSVELVESKTAQSDADTSQIPDGMNIRLNARGSGCSYFAAPASTADNWVKGLTSSCKVAGMDTAKENNKQEPLYEDDRVALLPNCVVVKWYFFPFGSSKIIPLKNIHSAVVPQNLDLFNSKSWGMAADFDVWWARAFRILAHIGVYKDPEPRIVINHKKWPSVGFSCKDRSTFLTELNRLLNDNRIGI